MVAAALAGWPVTVGVVEVGGVSQPGADAERYRCAYWLAGRGDGYQCGLDWGIFSILCVSYNRDELVITQPVKRHTLRLKNTLCLKNATL